MKRELKLVIIIFSPYIKNKNSNDEHYNELINWNSVIILNF